MQNKKDIENQRDSLKKTHEKTGGIHKTLEGIDIKTLYTSEDLDTMKYEETMPGVFPYTRGIRGNMYTGRPWTIRQYAGFSTAEASNKFYKECLAGGQTGLSVAFDLATHRGYDSDAERVAGDVGMAGVAIDSIEDMKILFQDIPLDKMSVSMTMNGAVLPILGAFIATAREQGVSDAALSGTIQNDILKEFMVRNTYIYPPAPSMRIVGDILAYTSKNMPMFNGISISGYHMHEAGATAVQELAFTLADGLAYVHLALDRGLSIDDFAPRLSFFFGIGMNFFMEIAKLRAARTLWAELTQTFNPQNPKSMLLRTHCQTSGVSLSVQDPHNNITRTTIEALAAVLGGTQSLHTNAFDEALALPSQESSRIARQMQLILQHEAGITETVDPLGGSYYVESLTQSLIKEARILLEKIDRDGGMVSAISSGWPKQMIEEAALKRQTRLEKQEDIIVGVNAYKSNQQPDVPILNIDTADVRAQQIRRLNTVKANRDPIRWKQAMDKIIQAAKGTANLMDVVIEAMAARATVGEVSSAMEAIFGRHSADVQSLQGVYAASLEGDILLNKMHKRTSVFKKRVGRRPRLLVAKLGQDGHDRGVKIIATAFADMGFDVDIAPLFQTPIEIAQQAVDHDVHVVGISTQAGGHKTLIPALIEALKTQGREDIVVICGGIIPEVDQETLKDLGVAAIFGPGGPITEMGGIVLDILENKNITI